MNKNIQEKYESSKEKLKIPKIMELKKWLNYNIDKDEEYLSKLLEIPIDKLTKNQIDEILKYNDYFRILNILNGDYHLKYKLDTLDENFFDDLMKRKLGNEKIKDLNGYLKLFIPNRGTLELINSLSSRINGDINNYEKLSMNDAYIYHKLYEKCFNKKSLKVKLLSKTSN